MDDIRAYEKLIAAVVASAVADTFLPPLDTEHGLKLQEDVASAFEFIYEHGGPWLEMIDIDPIAFKNQMDRQMYSVTDANIFKPNSQRGFEIDDNKRRTFKINYQLWNKEKVERSLASGIKGKG